MEKKLTNAENSQLTGLYRSHPLLWDMNSKCYRRNDLKIKAYNEIALEMGLPAEIIKKKIRSLRSTYTAEKKKADGFKKSGVAVDDMYVPSLAWYHEMSFLDSSIVTRKSSDNSNEATDNSINFDDYIEENVEENSFQCENSFSGRIHSKHLRKSYKDEESSKFDEALDKLIKLNDNGNEFYAFATSVAQQLEKLPEEDAYELMGQIQLLLTERKLKCLAKPRYPSSDENTRFSFLDNLTSSFRFKAKRVRTSTEQSLSLLNSSTEGLASSSDVLSTAISNAEIVFTIDD